MAEAAAQHRAIDALNAAYGSRFRLIRGIEANIGSDGQLDLSADEALQFELVLAAPHSRLRKTEDQTSRLLAAIQNPAVHVLAHPRGRISGSRGDRRRLERGVRARCAGGRCHRTRWRPGPTGPRPHACRARGRGRLPLRARQRRTYAPSAPLFRDGARSRTACRGPLRSRSELLARRSPARLAVRSKLSEHLMTGHGRKVATGTA